MGSLSCNCPAQARQKLSSTCGSISQMYSFVEQATEATAAQLESTKLALQQHAAKQPAVAEAPLEPGPGQVGGEQSPAVAHTCCWLSSAGGHCVQACTVEIMLHGRPLANPQCAAVSDAVVPYICMTACYACIPCISCA